MVAWPTGITHLVSGAIPAISQNTDHAIDFCTHGQAWTLLDRVYRVLAVVVGRSKRSRLETPEDQIRWIRRSGRRWIDGTDQAVLDVAGNHCVSYKCQHAHIIGARDPSLPFISRCSSFIEQ